MYKGENDSFKKEVEKLNQTSDYFSFSFSDLELCDRWQKKVAEERDNKLIYQKRRKCRLLSEELKTKLREIIVKGKPGEYVPQFDFIDFGLRELCDSIWLEFENILFSSASYDHWLRLNKKSLIEKSTISNGNLYFDSWSGEQKICLSASLIPERWRYFSSSESYQQMLDTRSSSLTQIDQELQAANIDLEELGSEYFFRSDCLCDGNLSPSEEKKLSPNSY